MKKEMFRKINVSKDKSEKQLIYRTVVNVLAHA